MTPHEVLEHVFTHANPDTGSPPPPHVAWVVFENGTAFYTFPNDTLAVDATSEQLVAAANTALDELGPVRVGTPSADFNPMRLASWFPAEPVWFVGFDHPAIATVVIGDGSDLSIGLGARASRQMDFEARKVAAVRSFNG